MKKLILFFIIILFLFINCNHTETKDNSIIYDNKVFIIHSENLIQIRSKDSLSNFNKKSDFKNFSINKTKDQIIKI